MAGGDLNLVHVALSLRDELDAFSAGAAEFPGMRSILESAAQHFPVAGNDRTSCEDKYHVGAKRRRGSIAVGTQTSCEHSCPEHKEAMSRALWGALPKELLHMIFARLPLAEIIRLKCLSKEWKTNLETAHSEFNQVCEATNSRNSFALVTTDSQRHGVFWARVFDMKANRWHEFEFVSGDDYCVEIVACGGGLVCLLSVDYGHSSEDESGSEDSSPKRLFLTVWNPLTREKHRLPVLDHLDGLFSTMVQLVVDPETKHYKVMVANDKALGESAYIYDSQSQQWSKVEKSSKVIFGMSYCWPYTDERETDLVIHACQYYFAEAELRNLKYGVGPWGRDNVASYAVTEDRLFVLHGFEGHENVCANYCISEYYADVNVGNAESGSGWVLERSHCCGPFERAPWTEVAYSLDLFAYKGFLLVCAQDEENSYPPYHFQRLWLYNLSTGKWRDLPNLIKYEDIYEDPRIVFYETVLCELRLWHILR